MGLSSSNYADYAETKREEWVKLLNTALRLPIPPEAKLMEICKVVLLMETYYFSE